MRIAVIGARGHMGRATCAALQAADDFTVHAEIDLGDPYSDIAGADAAVIFTSPDAVLDAIAACVGAGIPALVGTTGFDQERTARVAELVAGNPGATVVIVPNFSVGAVLMMQCAALAAPHFPSVEIIEEHHVHKIDAPSGTARRTAEIIGEARGGQVNPDATVESISGARGALVAGVPIHSVRLPGKLAHQEVVFGGIGETLTIRHDSTDRASFMPGVLAALRQIKDRPGLTVGLEKVLGFDT